VLKIFGDLTLLFLANGRIRTGNSKQANIPLDDSTVTVASLIQDRV